MGKVAADDKEVVRREIGPQGRSYAAQLGIVRRPDDDRHERRHLAQAFLQEGQLHLQAVFLLMGPGDMGKHAVGLHQGAAGRKVDFQFAQGGRIAAAGDIDRCPVERRPVAGSQQEHTLVARRGVYPCESLGCRRAGKHIACVRHDDGLHAVRPLRLRRVQKPVDFRPQRVGIGRIETAGHSRLASGILVLGKCGMDVRHHNQC